MQGLQGFAICGRGRFLAPVSVSSLILSQLAHLDTHSQYHWVMRYLLPLQLLTPPLFAPQAPRLAHNIQHNQIHTRKESVDERHTIA
jgi:hypothetical protein